jgi:hypothetical protein
MAGETKQRAAAKKPSQQQHVAPAAQPVDEDAARLAKTKKLVMQTSAVVFAVMAAAYFQLVSDKFALGIIVVMCLVLRFLAN